MPTDSRASSGSIDNMKVGLKYGGPTDTVPSFSASEISGASVPANTVVAAMTSSTLLKRRNDSRDPSSNPAVDFSCGARQAYRLRAPPIMMMRKARIKMPRLGSAANECTDTSTPERTRKVPSMLSEKATLVGNGERMHQRSTHQPRHERGVLDRIPEPEAAPAELVVRPEASQCDATGEEGPRGGRPRPRPARPGLVQPAFEHRRAGECKGHGKAHIAGVENGRVNRQRRILQDRIQVAAVGGGRVQAQEGIGGGEREQQEPEADESEHAQHARREARRQTRGPDGHRYGPGGKQQDPQQERALV